MRIEELRIARYRSLFDIVLHPRQFTVLVGANNSGKTNFADAVDFLADTYRYGLEIAIGRKGGFENIAHRKQRRTKSPVMFQVQATVLPTEVSRQRPSSRAEWQRRSLRITHRFEVEAKGQAIEAAFRVTNEFVAIAWANEDRDDQRLLTVKRVGGVITVTDAATQAKAGRPAGERAFLRELFFPFTDAQLAKWLATGEAVQPTELMVGLRAFNTVLTSFARIVASSRVYQLAPLESRRSGVPTPNPDLGRHGDNLPAFVAQIRKTDAKLWEQLLQMMRRLVPGLEEIRTEFTPDRRLTLQFLEAGSGRPWSSDDVSDGTIQSLAMFAALFDPRSALVVIEEPENSVHPWIVRNFVEACRAASNKQIILTTHSPALINYLSPAELAVVWRNRGETTIRPLPDLDPDALRLWSAGETSTFEIIDSGWVPQTVPGESG